VVEAPDSAVLQSSGEAAPSTTMLLQRSLASGPQARKASPRLWAPMPFRADRVYPRADRASIRPLTISDTIGGPALHGSGRCLDGDRKRSSPSHSTPPLFAVLGGQPKMHCFQLRINKFQLLERVCLLQQRRHNTMISFDLFLYGVVRARRTLGIALTGTENSPSGVTIWPWSLAFR
jgi:hypothetical protein